MWISIISISVMMVMNRVCGVVEVGLCLDRCVVIMKFSGVSSSEVIDYGSGVLFWIISVGIRFLVSRWLVKVIYEL